MIRFNNDYNHGAHPAVLEALAKTNDQDYPGYGLDPWCEKAGDMIRDLTACPNAEVHFLLGGTQANYTVICAALRPYESVICADSGHIHVHETGAVEATGHKIEALPGVNGKITAEQIAAKAESYRVSEVPEHITQPKLVYISFPTEFGTIYSKAELMAIRDVCRRYDLYLFIDGARMGYALGASDNDVSLADIAACADAFYIGGTKCGALFGEAVVLTNPKLYPHFRNYIKQNGGMLAKGWLLGLQFAALLQDDVYFKITGRADEYAMRIKEAFARKGIPAYIESTTNQQFVILTKEQRAKLAEKYVFEFHEHLSDGRDVVRFCTAWSTRPEEIDALTEDIAEL